MMAAVSSTESVVWVMKARRSGSVGAMLLASASSCTRVIRPHGKLAHGAFDLRVAGMADHEDVARGRAAAGVVALRLAMDLADQRTGRVEVDQLAPLRLMGDGFGDAVAEKTTGASDGTSARSSTKIAPWRSSCSTT